MQFHPKALVVTAVFVALFWFSVERGFGLVAVAAVLAVALDAMMGWGFWYAVTDGRLRRKP
jgi:uncharacterized membrane protein